MILGAIFGECNRKSIHYCSLRPTQWRSAVKGEDEKLPKKREELCAVIKEKALAWAIGWQGPEVIDAVNILEATKKAMAEAVNGLSVRPQHVLIDGNFTVRALDLPQTAIVKGDANSTSIAAASILAKVTRDRYMEEMALQYPGYAFENNKGYGTKAHYDGLKAQGPCPIHRKTFISGYL